MTQRCGDDVFNWNSVIRAIESPTISSALRRVVRRNKRRNTKRTLRNWVYDQIPLGELMGKNNSVFVGASDVTDYFLSKMHIARFDRGLATSYKDLTIIADIDSWPDAIVATGLRLIHLNDERGMVFDDDVMSFFEYDISARSITIKLHGDFDFVQRWYKHFSTKYEVVTSVIEWMYGSDGRSVEVPVRSDRVPVDEMYPWLNGESLTHYYDRFMKSDASILLLIGQPGTGKTTFIRGLLQHTQQSAIVTYDASILEKDYVFADFVEGKLGIMVIEDADNFLRSRSDGNDIMHKFLNVGDGLVTTKNKKMIFSTNLPSVRNVDSALIRPGRCFDVIEFTALNRVNAQALCTRLNVDFDPTKDEYTIAEIFHKQNHAQSPKRTVGFV